ncbi:MAG: hypothetical protein ACFFCW_17005 [Candidatus Hodarchaeota archaeon]
MSEIIGEYVGGIIVVVFLLVWPVAFMIPLGILFYYKMKKALTTIKSCILLGLCVILMIFNPILQRIALDSLDKQRLQAMIETAHAHKLIGKSEDDVYKIFGEPKEKRTWFNATIAEGGNCDNGPYKDRTDYVVFTYSATSFYMFSRTFQVSFTDGIVDDYREIVYDFP